MVSSNCSTHAIPLAHVFFYMKILQLLFLLLTGTVAFPLLEEWLEERDDIRRAWIMYDNVLVSSFQRYPWNLVYEKDMFYICLFF